MTVISDSSASPSSPFLSNLRSLSPSSSSSTIVPAPFASAFKMEAISKVNYEISNAVGLEELPEEVVMMIFSKLDLQDLKSMTLVSKAISRLARDSHLWKGLFITLNPTEGVPDPRLWCSTAVINSKMYLYGGHTTQEATNLISNVKNDLYEYDFEKRNWKLLSHSMGGKTEHKCVSYNDSLWFTGGYNGQDYTNDTYTFDPETGVSAIVETTGERFSPRSALTVGVWKGKMYTFGGWNGFSRKWFNDVYELDLDMRRWRRIDAKGPMPVQRTSHASVIQDGKMYIFGGFSGENYLNDLWEFDIESETWTDISQDCFGEKPAPRSRFCAAVYGNSMYILGGWNKIGYFEDLHTFNFTSRTWCQIKSPKWTIPSTSQYSFSIHNDLLYIFGGYCAKRKECVNDMVVFKMPEQDRLAEEVRMESEPPKKKSCFEARKIFEEVVTSSS